MSNLMAKAKELASDLKGSKGQQQSTGQESMGSDDPSMGGNRTYGGQQR